MGRATAIKPSDPNETGWMLGTKGNHFAAQHVTLIDLISFAYELHARQIVGGPEWIRTATYDLEGAPEAPGRPSREQLEAMVRGLLANRLQLKVSHGKKELAVYALLVAKNGPKFKESAEVEGEHSGYNFRSIVPRAEMTVMHMTMDNFASALQRTVMDRPVVNLTGLAGRYSFTLSWTPDDSQFLQWRGTGVNSTPPREQPDMPPGLFAGIQEELGLKLQPTRMRVDVVVVEQIERPTAN